MRTIAFTLFFVAALQALYIKGAGKEVNRVLRGIKASEVSSQKFEGLTFLSELSNKTEEVVQSPMMITVFEQKNVSSKYDKCLDDIEPIAVKFIDMAKLCCDGKWQETFPLFGEAMQMITDNVKCFQDAQSTFRIDPQCVVDHLMKAGAKVQDVISDIANQNFDKLQEDVKEIVAILKDTQNC